jgi:hypothetical protein
MCTRCKGLPALVQACKQHVARSGFTGCSPDPLIPAAAQGNGVERCKQHFGEQSDQTFIVDVYNSANYPSDQQAKQVSHLPKLLR